MSLEIIGNLKQEYKTRINELNTNLVKNINIIMKSNDKNKKIMINKLIEKHKNVDIPLLKEFYNAEMSELINISKNNGYYFKSIRFPTPINKKKSNNIYLESIKTPKNENNNKVYLESIKTPKEEVSDNNNNVYLESIKTTKDDDKDNNNNVYLESTKLQDPDIKKNINYIDNHNDNHDKIKKTYLETNAATKLDKTSSETVTTSETTVTSNSNQCVIETITKTTTIIKFINE